MRGIRATYGTRLRLGYGAVRAVLGLILLAAAGLKAHQLATGPTAEAGLLTFEKTAELVTTGVYRTIRHPMYSSLLLLAWGAFWKMPSWAGAALVAAATGCLFATARTEEQENLRFFGPAYAAYMRQTRRFIPFLF